MGQTLLRAVVSAAEDSGIWTLQCSIFPENTASLTLHRAAGFRVVGIRERVAKMTCGRRPANGGTPCSWSGAAAPSGRPEAACRDRCGCHTIAPKPAECLADAHDI